MGSMFRSEEMDLCQLFIQPEVAYQAISEVGELGCVQFRDLNTDTNSFRRKFVQEIRRCDELERKIRRIEKEIRKHDIILPEITDDAPKAPNPRSIIDLEAQIERTENEIIELSINESQLKANTLDLIELLNVLENTEQFFSAKNVADFENVKAVLNKVDVTLSQKRAELGYIAGMIRMDRLPAFERMLWRVSRGNVLLRRVDIDEEFEDLSNGNMVKKSVFIVFFQGEELKARIKKICTGFHASIYNCPNEVGERQEMIKGVSVRLEDLKRVLNETDDYRHKILVTVARELPVWQVMVCKMKAIYHTLNMFNVDVTQKCLIGEGWIPVSDVPMVQKVLSSGSAAAGSTVPSFLNVIHTTDTPPTYNRTNRVTQGFQNLIDAYGLASYREANPALYTIITFPFLFAVMFGDFGHALILTAFGSWMCICEQSLIAKRIKSEIWQIFFSGRYIILLMGIFSMYTGLIYNDIFSLSANIFGSAWRMNFSESLILNNTLLAPDPRYDLKDNIYPFGMDPVWQLAQNKIVFLNSFKMKLSIILGVVHMIFGICVGVINHVHLRKKINIIGDFLPSLIFLLMLFGYLVFLVFFKYLAYSAQSDEFVLRPGCAPSVLILFISMVMFKEVTPLENCDAFMFPGQNYLQMVLFVIAIICIPWMLLMKPIYIMVTRKNKTHHVMDFEQNTTDASNESLAGGSHDEEEEEAMGEIWIHQAIHTIEYVLSTVSHTASYLRLWALSLAHAQLSEILWGQLFRMGLKMDMPYYGSVIIFVIFAIWAFFTVAILVLMEGLSAFLHTLRLHWVEFMSKFYEGEGYPFEPLNFNKLIDEFETD